MYQEGVCLTRAVHERGHFTHGYISLNFLWHAVYFISLHMPYLISLHFPTD